MFSLVSAALVTEPAVATVPPAQAFVFHSNLGRAYEENGQDEPALAEYKAALDGQASFARNVFEMRQLSPEGSNKDDKQEGNYPGHNGISRL